MKISYERLNQIIEEEVVRFKSLNEDTQITADPATKASVQKMASLVATLATTEKLTSLSIADLNSLYTKLGGK